MAAEVLSSIELAACVSLGSFVVLLLVFVRDVVLIFIGVIAMVLILLTSMVIHIYFATPVEDLLDVIVLIAIIGMVVDFPAHVLLHYKHERSKRLSQMEPRFARKLVPAAASTTNYMLWALLAPTIMVVLSALPLLYATLALLYKLGTYIIIMVIVAYVVSVLFIPYASVLATKGRPLTQAIVRLCPWSAGLCSFFCCGWSPAADGGAGSGGRGEAGQSPAHGNACRHTFLPRRAFGGQCGSWCWCWCWWCGCWSGSRDDQRES